MEWQPVMVGLLGVSEMQKTHLSMVEKLALAGSAASLALCTGTVVEGAIVASANVPLGPPTNGSANFLDVDGDGTNDFRLRNWQNSTAFALLDEINGGRIVVPATQVLGGIEKLSTGLTVGSAMAGFKFFSNAQLGITITTSSGIGDDAALGGWTMGETGYFGYRFTSGANTYYGWGELVIDPANNGTAGYGYKITQMYYEDTGAAIQVGDAGGGGAVPEPATYTLALLAAGGVAAYRARRRVAAA